MQHRWLAAERFQLLQVRAALYACYAAFIALPNLSRTGRAA